MIEIIAPKLNIVLDASKIDLYETCPARYNFRHNLNKIAAPRPSAVHKRNALDIGSLAHNGLEVYFKALAEGTHYSDRMESCLNKIRELASDPSSDTEPEEVEEVMKAVEESCDFWRAEDENSLEILAVEEPFAYLLFEDDDVRIIISGKIDVLCNFRAIGRGTNYTGLPIDHKTFTRNSPVLRKSNQFINYCNAVSSNYLMVNRIGLQKSLKQEEKYQRIPLSYDPTYIEDWKNNLTQMILNEYLISLANNKWVEKPTSCNKFNRRCEYYDICDSSGEDAKIFKLEQQYVDAPVWDVTQSMTSDSDK